MTVMTVTTGFDWKTLQIATPGSSKHNNVLFRHANPKWSTGPPAACINASFTAHHDTRLNTTYFRAQNVSFPTIQSLFPNQICDATCTAISRKTSGLLNTVHLWFFNPSSNCSLASFSCSMILANTGSARRPRLRFAQLLSGKSNVVRR